MRGRIVSGLLAFVLIGAAGVGAAMAMSASSRSSSGTVRAVANSKYGMVLVSSSGRTLYRYALDKKGVSKCSGACAKFWPPYQVKATTKPTAGGGAMAKLVGTIKRAHGMAQVTYAGFPLYLYAGDHKAGDTTGQGFEGKWHMVNPQGAVVTHAVASKPSTTSTTTTKSGWG